jgi:superfamily II DNA helicase RecQ
MAFRLSWKNPDVTGYGKTKIYAHLPEIYEHLDNFGTVLVISPLKSLMMDQVTKLTSIGINATLVGECQKDKGVADKIAEGAFTTVFTSPEAALTPNCMCFICVFMLIFVCILCHYICIFGKKLLRACVYCYSKTEFK